jgi:hypothetical protein
MKGTSIQSKAALEMITACKRLQLSGMIEQIRIPKPHRIGDGEVIYALVLGIVQGAQCTEAHRPKSNQYDDAERAAKSLEAPAFQDHLFADRTEALGVLLLPHGKKTRQASEPPTANRWRVHRSAQKRKARRRQREFTLHLSFRR